VCAPIALWATLRAKADDYVNHEGEEAWQAPHLVAMLFLRASTSARSCCRASCRISLAVQTEYAPVDSYWCLSSLLQAFDVI